MLNTTRRRCLRIESSQTIASLLDEASVEQRWRRSRGSRIVLMAALLVFDASVALADIIYTQTAPCEWTSLGDPRTCRLRSGSGVVCEQAPPVVAGSDTILSCRPKATASGDPHLATFGGLLYDFHAVGEFLLATDGQSYEVQVRQQAWNECAAAISAAATRVGSNRVAVYADESPSLKVDGVPVEIPCLQTSASLCTGSMALSSGGIVFAARTDAALKYDLLGPDLRHLTTISVRRGGYLDVEASGSPAELVGLLGSAECKDCSGGVGSLATRSGVLVPESPTFDMLYGEFADSWRVTQAESLFDYGPQEDTTTFTDRGFPKAHCPPPPVEMRTAAEAICRDVGITNGSLLDACVFDVVMTGDATFADSYRDMAAPREAMTLAATEQVMDSWTEDGAPQFARHGCACAPPGAGTALPGFVGLLLSTLLIRRRVRGPR